LLRYTSMPVWSPGWTFREDYVLEVPATTPPGAYHVQLALYPVGRADVVQEFYDTRSGSRGQRYEVGKLRVTRPRVVADPQTLQVPVRTEHSFGAGFSLLGHSRLPPAVTQGSAFPLTLFWYAEHEPGSTLLARLCLVDASGRIAAESMVPPVPTYGTELWQAGDLWEGTLSVMVPPTAAGKYRITISLGNEEALTLGDVDIVSLPRIFTKPEIAMEEDVRFGDLVSLVGYEYPSTVSRGQPVNVTLLWHPERETGDRYKIYVHILDAEGNLVAQHDSEAANWTRPSTTWVNGEYLLDEHEITLPSTAPVGQCGVLVGVYDAVTGVRLMTAANLDHQVLDQPIEILP